MSALRECMIGEMKLRGFAPSTQRSYLKAVVALVKHYGLPPDWLTAEEVHNYLLVLANDRQLQPSRLNVVLSALRFFYVQTLQRRDIIPAIPTRKTVRRLPDILSAQELRRLFAAAGQLKSRLLLLTAYGGGLRVSEVIRLRLSDIDAQRLMLRVCGGKGQGDRYTLLPRRLLQELEASP